jgi:hypothetical protein
VSARHVATRIVDHDVPRVPIQPATYSPRLPLAVGVSFFFIAGFFALFVENDPFGLLVFSLSVALLLLFIAGVAMQSGLKERAVRIDAQASVLRFVGSPVGYILFVATATVALTPGALVLSAMLTLGSQLGGLAFIGLSLVALIWLGQLLWSLTVPPGLSLSESGLRGVRGTKSVNLDWDDLAGARVVFVKDSRLVLDLTTGGAIILVPHYTGSDPNVMAAVINYYRVHPEERSRLANPRAALDHVEKALASR